MLEILNDNIYMYLLGSQGTFFNKSSASPWEQTVPFSVPFSVPIFSLTPMMQILYKKKLRPLISLTHAFLYWWCSINWINNPNFANWIPLIYPQRTWDQIINRNSFLYLIYLKFLPSSFYLNLWQKWWHQFCHYNFCTPW